MARKARVEFAGAVYHLLARGDRREAIFKDDADRRRFLESRSAAPGPRLLGEACGRTGWRVQSDPGRAVTVLMSNHDHLLAAMPEANLVAGMRWFQTTWTMRFKRPHRLGAHLFDSRYQAMVVAPEEQGCFAVLSDDIRLNPPRARLA